MPLTLITTALRRINKGGPERKGTDYIVFECPACKCRNKQSLYELVHSLTADRVAFKCKTTSCRTIVEVRLPVSDGFGLIIDPNSNRPTQGTPKIIHG